MSGRGCLYRRGRIYWVKLSVNGKPVYMTSHSSRREDAVRLLNSFLGDAARGKPVIPKADQVKFEDAVAVLLRNYRINGRRSLAHVERRIRLHWLHSSVPVDSLALPAPTWPNSLIVAFAAGHNPPRSIGIWQL
jgi:hypothetical protein